MAHGIARFFEPLLRLLFRIPGRYRAPTPHLVTPSPDTPAIPLPSTPVLRGEDIGLVRPYLVAHERREEERQQQARRRTLVLASYGIDTGPRRIHGMEVTV